MKRARLHALLGVLLLVAGASLAARLDQWFMGWPGNRAADFNPLTVFIGEGQRLFAAHFYRKADVYFHSGMYPTIFDNNESFKTAHMAEDAGATASKNEGDEDNYLGHPRDIIDRFSRNLFPSHHTHLDHGGAAGSAASPELAEGESGEVREILPWLQVAAKLDPEVPETYTVTAYWLRERMGKVKEAEFFLREGLKHLPNHPALLFELGRICSENQKNPDRARNLWQSAAREWVRQESEKLEPDRFMFAQIHGHLAKLEEEAGNLSAAIAHWELLRQASPSADAVGVRIAELRARQSAKRETQ